MKTLMQKASIANALESPSKRTKRNVFIAVGLLAVALFVVPVLADPTLVENLKTMLNSVSKWMMIISIPLAVMLIVFNMIKYMGSSDPKVGQQCKSNIGKILIALVVINSMPYVISLIATLMEGMTDNTITWTTPAD